MWLFITCGVVCWFCSTCESLAACCCRWVNMVEIMSFVHARVASAGLGGEFPPCFVFGCLEEEFGDSYLGLKRRG
jgi:hypothetical protein